MRRPLNVSVIGCGYWGPNLVRNFRSLADCQVTAICDRDEERLAQVKRLYPEVLATTDFEDIASNRSIDAVGIATPSGTHYELAKRSLCAGKHVMVEKPMAASSDACRELIGLAEGRGLTLMVGHTFVYSPPVRLLKQIVDSGSVGEILHIDSQRLNLGLFQRDINVAWDLAPHDISIILFLLGSTPIAVNCHGKAHVTPGIEDLTAMHLEFPAGTTATIGSSWLNPTKTRLMTIIGSEQMIVYEDTATVEKVRLYDRRVTVRPGDHASGGLRYSYHNGDVHAPKLIGGEPLAAECEHFLDCIRSGVRPESAGQDGLNVVQILEAASQSLREGGARVAVAADPIPAHA